MTDNEIIKALECLEGEMIPCKDCSYVNYARFDCKRQAAKDTLDLINRQNAEIERLQIVHKYIDKAILGNKEFAIADEYLIAYQYALKQLYDNTKIKAEAVKEFAEKLKHMFGLINGFDYDCSTIYYHIDNLVKEMVGEG